VGAALTSGHRHSQLGYRPPAPVPKLGSGAIGCLIFNVRFTPKSGHTTGHTKCPLSAKSGHRSISAERPQMIEFANNLAVEFCIRQLGHLAL